MKKNHFFFIGNFAYFFWMQNTDCRDDCSRCSHRHGNNQQIAA